MAAKDDDLHQPRFCRSATNHNEQQQGPQHRCEAHTHTRTQEILSQTGLNLRFCLKLVKRSTCQLSQNSLSQNLATLATTSTSATFATFAALATLATLGTSATLATVGFSIFSGNCVYHGKAASGDLRESLGGLPGKPWETLGEPWENLGEPWGRLGGPPGRLWDALGEPPW